MAQLSETGAQAVDSVDVVWLLPEDISVHLEGLSVHNHQSCVVLSTAMAPAVGTDGRNAQALSGAAVFL
jgi:hypothetical protein